MVGIIERGEEVLRKRKGNIDRDRGWGMVSDSMGKRENCVRNEVDTGRLRWW
jgi:hypothetical protein